MGARGGGDWCGWWDSEALYPAWRASNLDPVNALATVNHNADYADNLCGLARSTKPDRAPEDVAAFSHDRERLADSSREAEDLRHLACPTFIYTGAQRNKLKRHVDDSIRDSGMNACVSVGATGLMNESVMNTSATPAT